MRPYHLTLFAITFSILAGLSEATPDSSAPKETIAQAQRGATKRADFTIKVIIENAGKEVASYIAYRSDFVDRKVDCTGSLALDDNGYWRARVEADMSDSEFSFVRIDIDDLKAFTRGADGVVSPIVIFSTTLQSRGPGAYLMGQVQGMTIKVEISETEQASLGQPATRPLSK